MFGIEITYYGSLPVAVAGIYFFTIISVVAAFAIVKAKRRDIIDAICLTICGLAFYEAVLSFAYALYSGDMLLLIPKYDFPVTGWPGYSTWFIEEVLIFLLSYPLWKQMRIGKLQLVLIVLFSALFLVWSIVFDFLYPPISYSFGVLFINTITELTGTVLPAVFVAPKGNYKRKWTFTEKTCWDEYYHVTTGSRRLNINT